MVGWLIGPEFGRVDGLQADFERSTMEYHSVLMVQESFGRIGKT